MRISDWSSDVCSSDLVHRRGIGAHRLDRGRRGRRDAGADGRLVGARAHFLADAEAQYRSLGRRCGHGRASLLRDCGRGRDQRQSGCHSGEHLLRHFILLRTGLPVLYDLCPVTQTEQTRSGLCADGACMMLNVSVARRSSWQHRFYLMKASALRSEEHTSELQSLMRISYAVFCLKKKKTKKMKNKIHIYMKLNNVL